MEEIDLVFWISVPTCIGNYYRHAYYNQYNWGLRIIIIAVNCNSPPSISNGSPDTPTSTTVGGTVTYSCNTGYVLSGSATVTCEASGGWSTRPTCESEHAMSS